MKRLFAFFAVLTLTGCEKAPAPAAQEIPSEQYSSTGEIFYLPPRELRLAERKAKAGDNLQLQRVINHYLLGGDYENENLATERVRWLTLGAARGVKGARQNLLHVASSKAGPPCPEVRHHYALLEPKDQGSRREYNDYLAACLIEKPSR